MPDYDVILTRYSVQTSVRRSIDDGATFVDQNLGAPFENVQFDQWGIPGLGRLNGGLRAFGLAIDKTDDGGATWSALTALPVVYSIGNRALYRSPANPGVMCAGVGSGVSTARIARSINNGLNWATIMVDAGSNRSIGWFVSNKTGVLLASPTGGTAAANRVYRSDDDGATWAIVINPGVIGTQALTWARGFFYAIESLTIDFTIRRSIDGAAWNVVHTTAGAGVRPLASGFRNGAHLIDVNDDLRLLHAVDTSATTQTYVYRSTNGGTTWAFVGAVPPLVGGADRGGGFARTRSRVFFFDNINNASYVTINQGTSWAGLGGIGANDGFHPYELPTGHTKLVRLRER